MPWSERRVVWNLGNEVVLFTAEKRPRKPELVSKMCLKKLNTTLLLEFSEQEKGLSLLRFICKQTLLCLVTINDRVINKLKFLCELLNIALCIFNRTEKKR